ncbi:MAG: hypothetical protein ACPGVP_21925, partial [Thiolinea sp.]
DQPGSERYQSLITDCREQLAEKNLINMEAFLTQAGTARLCQEIEAKMPEAFHSVSSKNPTFIETCEALNDEQLLGNPGITDRYSLARHQLLGSVLDELYQYPPLRRFVGDVLALDEIYLHEDPSNALVVQLYKTDGGIAWHFDRALFSTILNLCETEQGGIFECVPGLRTA